MSGRGVGCCRPWRAAACAAMLRRGRSPPPPSMAAGSVETFASCRGRRPDTAHGLPPELGPSASVRDVERWLLREPRRTVRTPTAGHYGETIHILAVANWRIDDVEYLA